MEQAVMAINHSFEERLSELEPERDETQAQFLGRIAAAADEMGDQALSNVELDNVRLILPQWRFSKPAQNSRYRGRADRLETASQAQEAILSEYRIPNERLFALDGEPKHIALITKATLRASDIACVLKVEAAHYRHAESPATPLPKPNTEPNDAPNRRLVTPELHEATGLLITSIERDAISKMALPVTAAAEQGSIDVSTVNKRMVSAMNRNKMDRKSFLLKTAKGNLIDMSLLPPKQDYEISEMELVTLREYPFDKLADLAENLKLQTVSDASQVRKSIAQKFDIAARNLTLAYLIAIRDGLIED